MSIKRRNNQLSTLYSVFIHRSLRFDRGGADPHQIGEDDWFGGSRRKYVGGQGNDEEEGRPRTDKLTT